MNTLGISLKERVISRMVFYIGFGITMWLLNRIVPEPVEQAYAQWEIVDPTVPLIAVPLSELRFDPLSR